MDTPDLDQLLTARNLDRAALMGACDVDKSTVSRWASRGIPLARIKQVEQATGIPKEQLRPDFFAEADQ